MAPKNLKILEKSPHTEPHNKADKTMLVFLLLFTLSAVVLGDDVADRAMVLARKSVTSEFKQPVGAEELTNVIVENRNFTVTLSLYNVGGLEAFEIEVEDEWEEDKFTLVDGSMRAAFSRLGPGENAEYSFVLSPLFTTPKKLYEYKPAMITYMYGEEDEQMETISTSSRPHTSVPNQPILDGKTYVLSEEDYKATTALYFREWLIYFFLAAVPILGPFFFWLQSSAGSTSGTTPSSSLSSSSLSSSSATVAKSTKETSTLKFIILVAGTYFFYLFYGVFQEAIWTKEKNGDRFNSTLLLLLIQCAVNVMGAVIFAAVLNALGMSSGTTISSKAKEASEKAITAPGYIRGLCGARLTGNLWMGCISFFYVFAMGASNQALQHVNYPTQALGKSCKLIPIMLANVIINGKSYSMTKYLSVLFMTTGIVLFRMYKAPKANCTSFTDVTMCGSAKTCEWSAGACEFKASEPNSTLGLMLLAISLCLDGLTASNQTLYREEFSSPTLDGALRMMRQTNLWACLYVGVLAIATGDLFEGFTYIMAHPSLLWAIMKFSLCSACGQCFIFLTITGPGPLVCTTVTTTRKFFTILISVFLNPKNSLTQMQWSSVGLVAIGLGGELYEKIFSKKKHKNKKA